MFRTMILLRKCLSLTIALSLILHPIAAAEIILNQITIQEIQQIQPQPDHGEKYALQLCPGLWQLEDQQQVLLVQDESPLGLFYRQNGQGALIFQTLKQPPLENESPSKTSHFHFYPDVHGQVTHGEININSEGRLSLQSGEYGGTTRIQAKRIYINANQNDQNSQTKIKGSFFLSGLKEVKNRTPIMIQGLFGLLTPLFNNGANIQAKGKGILQINKAENHGDLQFSKDSVITGYGDNAPFANFQNHNRIASKTKLILNGNKFEQSKNGICFAGTSLQASLNSLCGSGNFLAPLLHLQARDLLSFKGGLIQGYSISLKTKNWLGMDRPTFRAGTGIYLNADILDGEASFQVGSTSAWAFPHHLFYCEASPKGKRAYKLKKATSAYFETHPQDKPTLFGCHFKTQCLTLGNQTRFDLIGGPMRLETTFGMMGGAVHSGPYNQHGISINAQELGFPGSLSSLQADISAHIANLSGEFKVKDFALSSSFLMITGIVEVDRLFSLGKFFNLSESGRLKSELTRLNHDQVSINGHLNTQKLETVSRGFQVGSTGSVTCINAFLNNDQTSITGSMNAGSMDIHGNYMGVTGTLSAGQVTNHVSNWSVPGKADIGSFSSSTGALSLSGGSDFKIRQAAIEALYTIVGGALTIENLNLHGNRLTIHPGATLTGYNWNLDLTSSFDQLGDLSLSHLSLATPYWYQSPGATLNVGCADVHVGSANLQGMTTGGALRGTIDQLNLTGGIGSSQVNLHGDHFNNRGWIHNASGIDLRYNTYNLGNLSTQGTLALQLNDRVINEALLKDFEGRFDYKMLSLTTDQHLVFMQSLDLYRNLALFAPSITFKNPTRQTSKSWHIHGDLVLKSRNHTLSLWDFNIRAQNGSFSSAGDFILNDSSIQTQNQLLFDVKGNTVLNRLNRPSLLDAGEGGLYGRTGGKFINNVSDLSSDGALEISACHGFAFNAKENRYEESHTKRTHWGLGKNTTTIEWNEIISPTVQAVGPVNLMSEEGGAHFDSTHLISPSIITVATKGPVTNLERTTYKNTLTKKSTLFSRERIETKTQGDSPTVVVSMEGVNITSWDDKIDLPNTMVMAPHVLLDARKDVRLTVPTLRSSYSYESSGLTFSHALSGITTDPGRTLVNLDPVAASLMNLYDMRSQHPVNQASAGVMAGINGYNGYNAYKGYQEALANEGTPGSFAAARFLSSVCRVQIGYHDTAISSYQTTPGRGGIFAQRAVLRSQEGDIHTLNGVPLDAENLTISCPNGSLYLKGFQSEYGGSSESFNMVMGFNVLTMTPTDVSISASSGDYEGVHWIAQQITDKNPTIEAKSVHCLDGINSFHQSQSHFRFSVGQNSLGFNVNGYGINYAAAPGDGMLGSFGVQAKGLNFVVPIMGADSKPQLPLAQIQRFDEKHTLTATESPRQNQKYSKFSGSTRKKESSRPKTPVENFPTPIATSIANPIEESHQILNHDLWDDWNETVWSHDQPVPVKEEEKGYLMAALTGAKNGLVGLGESLWQLTKDISFLYAGATEQSRMREIAIWMNDEDIPSITDTVPYKQAKKNMGERIETVKSTAKLVKDSIVIFTGALREAHMLEIAPWLEDQQIHSSFLSTPLYQQSDRNMEGRIEAISAGYNYFSNQSTSNKIENIFEVATPIFAPWGVLKAGQHLLPQKTIFRPSPQRFKRQSNFTPFVHDPKAGVWNLWEINYSGYYSLDHQLSLPPIMHNHILDPKAPFIIHAHGSPTSVLYTTHDFIKNGANKYEIIAKNSQLDHRQLANLLKRQSDYKKGQPVVFISCSVGKKPDGFARKFANKIGAPVIASTGIVGVTDLELMIANTTHIQLARPIIEFGLKPFYGEFKTFYPGGWSPKNEVRPKGLSHAPYIPHLMTALDSTEYLGAYSIPKKVNGVVKQKTPNQLNQEIYKGKAPIGIDRVDYPHNTQTGQVHVHFKDGSAINKDGTWKEGNGSLTQKQKDWLKKNGWDLK